MTNNLSGEQSITIIISHLYTHTLHLVCLWVRHYKQPTLTLRITVEDRINTITIVMHVSYAQHTMKSSKEDSSSLNNEWQLPKSLRSDHCASEDRHSRAHTQAQWVEQGVYIHLCACVCAAEVNTANPPHEQRLPASCPLCFLWAHLLLCLFPVCVWCLWMDTACSADPCLKKHNQSTAAGSHLFLSAMTLSLTFCLFTLSFTPFPPNFFFLHISFSSVPSPAPHQFSLLSSLYSSAVALTPFLSVSFSSELCHPCSKRRVRGIYTL